MSRKLTPLTNPVLQIKVYYVPEYVGFKRDVADGRLLPIDFNHDHPDIQCGRITAIKEGFIYVDFGKGPEYCLREKLYIDTNIYTFKF